MAFVLATKEKAFLRLCLIGLSGSGKTYSALRIARKLAGPLGKVALIDTESHSSTKYSDRFRFFIADLKTFSPERYVEEIQNAAMMGVDVLIIDSLSHAWSGKDGVMEQVDKAKARAGGGNQFAGWREVTPLHNALVDAIIGAPMHVIVTMRAKTEYVMEEYTKADGSKGKKPVKMGMAPIQRDGLEYEFDVVGDMDIENNLIISKTRCPALSREVIKKPGEELATTLLQWLDAPTAEEILTFVQAEGEVCQTREDFQVLKARLYAKGGEYYSEAALETLRILFENRFGKSDDKKPTPAAAVVPVEMRPTPASPFPLEKKNGETVRVSVQAVEIKPISAVKVEATIARPEDEKHDEQSPAEIFKELNEAIAGCSTVEELNTLQEFYKNQGGAYWTASIRFAFNNGLLSLNKPQEKTKAVAA